MHEAQLHLYKESPKCKDPCRQAEGEMPERCEPSQWQSDVELASSSRRGVGGGVGGIGDRKQVVIDRLPPQSLGSQPLLVSRQGWPPSGCGSWSEEGTAVLASSRTAKLEIRALLKLLLVFELLDTIWGLERYAADAS